MVILWKLPGIPSMELNHSIPFDEDGNVLSGDELHEYVISVFPAHIFRQTWNSRKKNKTNHKRFDHLVGVTAANSIYTDTAPEVYTPPPIIII